MADNGFPAFPYSDTGPGGETSFIHVGMTLRQYRATHIAAAMATNLSDADVHQLADGILGGAVIGRAALVLADKLAELEAADNG